MSRRMNLIFAAIILVSIVAPAAAVTVIAPPNSANTPVGFGVGDLKAALAGVGSNVRIRVICPGQRVDSASALAVKALSSKPESFAIARSGRNIAIVGNDETGAMYGCFELAERLGMHGKSALSIKSPIAQSPAVEFRAINPFLTLPYKEDEKDWWFLQEAYWKGFLDQLARARINWIDLHGMYEIKGTGFPNIYPYFITSEKFPSVGVEPQVAARNLAMLKKVMRMAKQRGIKFAMMSYSAGWYGEGLRPPPAKHDDADLAAYTHEVVRKMIQACPDLEMIGFRIGESGKKESFYKDSYIPAIREAGRPIELYTRTWGANKPAILALGDEFRGRFTIEIKYNGEQFGPPYILAGGRMKGWHDYSYQKYFSYPKNYKVIYQLRANGTHRAFPWGNPELAARANEDSLLGGAVGLCVEPKDSYYPKYDFRHKDDSPNRWFKWQYQRDWFWYSVWGRTAYDPSLGTRDDVWVSMFAKRYGKPAAKDLYEAMKTASMIVPDAYTSYSLGPDHRNHAPELEWGGDVKSWAKGQPFDTQDIQTPKEFAERLVKGDPSAKATPLAIAGYLAQEAKDARHYIDLARSEAKSPTAEFNDLTTELTALTDLGNYYSHKLTAAALFAVMTTSSDASLESRIRPELDAARLAWDGLATIGDKDYKPFVDTLRMGTEEYTWSKEGQKLDGDMKALDAAVAEIKASGKTGTAPAIPAPAPSAAKIARVDSAVVRNDTNTSAKFKITVAFKDPDRVASVSLKTRPFPSDAADWTLAPLTESGRDWVGEAEVTPEGLMWCIEALDKDGRGVLWPDFRVETPYRVVLPWDAGLASAK